MRDFFSKITVLVSLAALLLVLSFALPEFFILPALSPLLHVLPWIAFGLLFWCFGSCCSRGCSRGRSHRQPSSEATV